MYEINSYQQQQEILLHEKLLYKASHPVVTLKLIDTYDNAHDVTFRDYRITDISLYTWLLYGLSWLKFIIGFATAKTGKFNTEKLIFLVVSSFIGIACFCSPFSLQRLWAINPDILFERFTLVNLIFRLHFFWLLIIFLLIPNDLFRQYKTVKILCGLLLLVLISTWALYFLPDMTKFMISYKATSFLPISLTLIVGYFALYAQWRLVHNSDDNRKITTDHDEGTQKLYRHHHFDISKSIALKWLMIVTIIAGFSNVLFNLLIQLQLIDGNGVLVLFFINSTIISMGVIAIILHKQLYQLETWWWHIWGLFFACSLGSASFILLSTIAPQFPFVNIFISGIMMVSTYFATVYYFQVKYAKTETALLTIAIPKIISINSQNTPNDINVIWGDILLHVFQPKYIIEQESTVVSALLISKEHTHQGDEVAIISNTGETLIVQAMANKVFVLDYAHHGLKLFTNNTLNKTQLLWGMVLQAHGVQEAYHKGELAERKRIACDLHDDIGGKLLHLSSQEGEYGNYARRTLKDLRTLTHALSSVNKSFDMLIADLRYQIRSYCDSQDIQLTFRSSMSNTITQHTISAQASINISCIVNELVRNALQNPNTQHIWITINANDDQSSLIIENDGDVTNPDSWVSGLGTVSVKRRINTLDGEIKWHVRNNGGVRLNGKHVVYTQSHRNNYWYKVI